MKNEIRQRVETSIGIGPLRHDTYALSHFDSAVEHTGTRDGRCPCRRTNTSGKNSKRRRFARAIRADHSKEFTLVHGELERIEGDNVSATGAAWIPIH